MTIVIGKGVTIESMNRTRAKNEIDIKKIDMIEIETIDKDMTLMKDITLGTLDR